MLRPFNIEGLEHLDEGIPKLTIDQAIHKAVLDCQDRPGEKKAREVQIKIALTPQADQHGNLTSIHSRVHVRPVIPESVTKTYELGVKTSTGQAYFNDNSLDNVQQMTLDEQAGSKAWEGGQDTLQERSDEEQ